MHRNHPECEAAMRPAGQGREVGVLFERDSYEKISFVHVETV